MSNPTEPNGSLLPSLETIERALARNKIERQELQALRRLVKKSAEKRQATPLFKGDE